MSHLNMHGIPTATSVPTGYAVECDTCRLYGHTAPSEDAAVQLAGIHDDLLHRGHPTADVRPA